MGTVYVWPASKQDLLTETKTMLPGTEAPNLVAKAYIPSLKETSKIELPPLNGKYTVLFFYPGDFGSVVLSEMLELKEAFKELSDEVNILVISTNTVESHKAFAELDQVDGGLQGVDL